MNRPIGYVAADVDGLSAPVLVEVLARAGYAAVDWTMEQFDPLADRPEALDELVRLAGAEGLAVPQLMVHQDYVVPDPAVWEERAARTERAIAAAANAGIPTVGLVTGPNRWVKGWSRIGEDLTERHAWDLALAALERALAAAQGTGVDVALEPCWGTLAWDSASADRVLEVLGPELRLNFDPSHFVMAREDVRPLIERWGPRIAHVHLKDAFGASGMPDEDFCFLLPGEGSTDWRGFRAGLDAIGYDRAMSVEFESFVLREQALAGSVEAGARLARRFVNGLLGEPVSA